jgi:hypothetical protein
MPYATRAAKNANQRRWRVTDRARRALEGICRDCSRSCVRADRQTVLCDHCYRKAYERRPDAMEAFRVKKRALWAHLQPLQADRRRGGKPSGALTWALQMRSI